MSTATDEQWARIVPCEVDGDIMYGAGMVFRRGRLLEDHTEQAGYPIYEWWPINPDETGDEAT